MASPKRELRIGDQAPAFTLPIAGGGDIGAAALKGTAYLLYFYPKDGTPGCTAEALAFAASADAFARLGVRIIGVSKDAIASHEKFAAKHELNFTLASDDKLAAAEAFGVWGEKKLYGKTGMGMERASFLIDDAGIIRQIWRKVKVAGHAEAVLEAAKRL